MMPQALRRFPRGIAGIKQRCSLGRLASASATQSTHGRDCGVHSGNAASVRLLWNTPFRASASVVKPSTSPEVKDAKKKKKVKNLIAWLWDQALHMWHGFRLLAINARTAAKLKNQVLAGQKLTRREQHLLETTTKDLLRLLPFSLFVIIPGAELLLPVALVIFPDLMPSTFTTNDQRRKQLIHRNLDNGIIRRRLFEHVVARVLVSGQMSEEQNTQIFRAVLQGCIVSAADIRSLAHFFQGDGPMANEKLPRYILRDLCQVLGIYSNLTRLEKLILPRTWHGVRLRYMLAHELERREEDDRLLANMDLYTLTQQELERENERRRMRWYGPKESLRQQLEDWLSLSLDPTVPDHILLFLKPCASKADILLDFLSSEERSHILGLTKYADTPMYNLLKMHTDQAARDAQKSMEAAKQAKEAKEAKEAEETKEKEEPWPMIKPVAEPDGEEMVQDLVQESRIESLDKPLMEEDLDDLKHHIQEVAEEVKACELELESMGRALRTWSDEDLLGHFDKIDVDADGTITVMMLEEALYEWLRGDVVSSEELQPATVEQADRPEEDVASEKAATLEQAGVSEQAVTSDQVRAALAQFDFENTGSIHRDEFKAFLSRCRGSL
eukprot:TRINITY_DN43158_c0_g1_i1.p1 TRINITY_DN43158_c0_g1~~TRINITY_DN43158_c0_g1_i1.p1  ORF type:complete len:615 (-),score=134.60 TRINITY_DN43158_c0_g1_i1:213-2057(-)